MTGRLLGSVAFIAMAATAALASDMPPPYLPPPRAPTYVPFFTWNGAYIGINAGYGFGTSRWTDRTAGVTTGDFDVSGALIGATLGYNMQWGGVLFGFETDLDWSNIQGSTSTVCLGSCKTSNTHLGTARGRIGYAFDRFMPYLTAGMAYGQIKASSAAASFSNSNIGWTAGAGMEYAFMNNWTAKIEYLYVDLGNASCDSGCPGGAPIDVKFTTGVVRGGINYKF
jgi:outer membrane immunogenic protein